MYVSLGILGLAWVLNRVGKVLEPSPVCLEIGFHPLSIMHGCMAEIICSDHLTPEGGVLPPFTQMTNVGVNG